MTDEEMAELEADGNAIKVGADGVIPQLHAKSMEEYLGIVASYQELAERFKASCFLRGQPAIYFDRNGCLDTSPAANRPTASGTPFFGFTNLEVVEEQLGPWLYLLGGVMDVDIGDCLRFTTVEPGSDYGIVRFFAPSVFTGKSSSEALEAILQHYGFPTYSLDVSACPYVAAWFALNKAQKNEDGVVTFAPKTSTLVGGISNSSNPQSLASVSTVLVYLQWLGLRDWPVVDLGGDEEIRRVAVRPIVQKAFSLPFLINRVSQPGDGIRVIDLKSGRCPAAAIKLHFDAEDLRRARQDLTAEYLLPLNDPLYLALMGVNAPHLAIYHSQRDRALRDRFPSSLKSLLPAKAPKRDSSRKPLPGSAGENPRASKVWERGQKVLEESGIKVRGGSFSQRDVVFNIDDSKLVPGEVQSALGQLEVWGNVKVYLCDPDEDSW